LKEVAKGKSTFPAACGGTWVVTKNDRKNVRQMYEQAASAPSWNDDDAFDWFSDTYISQIPEQTIRNNPSIYVWDGSVLNAGVFYAPDDTVHSWEIFRSTKVKTRNTLRFIKRAIPEAAFVKI
jgi:hypothetical protein